MSKKKVTDIKVEANSIIKNHMIWSMGAGFIPVPIVDFFAVSAIQLDMIRQLAKLYDIDFKETEGKAIITALTGTGLAQIGARAVKFIPGIGTMLGGITMAALSGGSTYALGEVFKKHFETGGTFLDFDPERLRRYYNEKFEKGKEIAKNLKRTEQGNKTSEEPSVTNEDNRLVEELIALGKLKENGIISEKEFEKLKKKIMSK